jgi:HEPN domain-containing protein
LNVQKHIEYWIAGAQDDILSAQVLLERGRLLHCLFFCHLVIEKAIKAHVVKATGEVAPRSHSLVLLSEKAGLVFDEDTDDFLGILMKYQLHGRYPDFNPTLPSLDITRKYLSKTEELLKWITEML